MRREEDTSKTCKIELTIKEKSRERQKPAQNGVFQIETAIKQRKNDRENQEKTATTKSTTISKQPNALESFFLEHWTWNWLGWKRKTSYCSYGSYSAATRDGVHD